MFVPSLDIAPEESCGDWTGGQMQEAEESRGTDIIISCILKDLTNSVSAFELISLKTEVETII